MVAQGAGSRFGKAKVEAEIYSIQTGYSRRLVFATSLCAVSDMDHKRSTCLRACPCGNVIISEKMGSGRASLGPPKYQIVIIYYCLNSVFGVRCYPAVCAAGAWVSIFVRIESNPIAS